MWLLIIEALLALFLLALIVWWTMYAGRAPERDQPARKQEEDEPGARTE